MMKLLVGAVFFCLFLACSAIYPGIPKIYEKPTDPPCIKELFEKEFSGFPARIVNKSTGFFDFKECKINEIGVAWIKEKKLRQQYENRLKSLN